MNSSSKDKGTLSQFEATYVGSALGIRPIEEEGQLVLKVYRGSMKGESFSFPFGKVLTIGRLESAEICLPHHSVSRLHSRIYWKNHAPWIADLGSTNGTFLNNAKVQDALLHEEDRLKIGDAALSVEFRYENEGTQSRIFRSIADSEEQLKKNAGAISTAKNIVSGSLEQIGLADILQSVVATKGEGILVVKGPVAGRIGVHGGKIVYAKSGETEGKKALYRLLAANKGQFDFRPLDDDWKLRLAKREIKKGAAEFSADITHTLLEFFRVHDEFSQIIARLPEEDDKLRYNPQKPLPKEKGLTRLQQIYDQVGETPLVKELLDEVPLIDMDIYRVLVFLLERGFLLRWKR